MGLISSFGALARSLSKTPVSPHAGADGAPFVLATGVTTHALTDLPSNAPYSYRVRPGKASLADQGLPANGRSAKSRCLSQALTRNATLVLEANGTATLAPAAVNNGSTADCAPATAAQLSVSPSRFSCANVGPNTVTLTVRDAAGNQSTATATVTVVDNTAPAVYCQPLTKQLDANGQASITLAELMAPPVVALSAATGNLGRAAAGDVAVGDLNGDGKMDVVYANTGANTVFLNDGTGTLAPHSTAPTFGSVADQHTAVALGDVDGDGDLDAVLAVYGGNESVWTNDGTGAFTLRSSFAGLGYTLDLDLADIDADGDLDALVVNYDGGQLWKNNGSGTFTDANNILAAGPNPHIARAHFAQLNNDGFPDVIMAREDGRDERVFLNNGAGTLAPHATVPGFGTGNNWDVATGDVDGDGDQDVAYALDGVGGVVVWYNDNNTGAFTTSQTFAAAPSISLAFFDIENDGDLDIVLGKGPLQVLINNGAGSFTALPTTVATSGAGINAFAVADLNGDGKMDVVTARAAANLPANLLLNASTRNADECSGITLTASKLNFDCTNLGANTVTLTATDASGNQASCQTTVTIQDLTSPTALAQDVTLTLAADGTATLTPAQVDNGSSDNCGITSRTLSRTTFSCADRAPNRYGLNFDGSNDHVTLPAGAIGNGAGFTFEAWVNFATTPTYWSRIFDFGAGTSSYLFLAPRSYPDATLRFAIRFNGGAEQIIDAPTAPLTGWHHYAVTLSKSGSTVTGRLYLDGVEVGSNPAMTLLPGDLGALTQTWLGRSQHPDPYPAATFDEVRLWDVARTGAAIAAARNQGLSGTEPGLRAYYNFEQSSGTTLPDATGHGYTGTLNGFGLSGTSSNWVTSNLTLAPAPVPVTLTVADAAGNQSTATARVTVQAPAPVAPTGLALSSTSVAENLATSTVVGTFSVTDPNLCAASTYSYALVSGAGSTDNARFSIGTGANAGKLLTNVSFDYETQSSYSIRVSVTSPSNLAYEQVLTIDVTDLIELSGTQTTACAANSGTATVAVAGVATGYSYTWNTTPVQTTASATGLAPGTYTVTVSKAGLADATRSFTIMADLTAPVAVVRDVTLTLAADGTAPLTPAQVDNGSSDNCDITSRTLSRTSFSCADIGLANRYAMSFDGTNDFLSVAAGSTPISYTKEAWVMSNLPSAANRHIISSNRNGISTFFCDNTGQLSARATPVGLGVVDRTSALPAATWVHVAVSFDRTTRMMRLYRNGVQVDSAITALAPTSALQIGALLGTSVWSGLMDEVRVWNTVRTRAQILATMHTPLTGSEAGLHVYYNFEDPSTPGVVVDVTGNGYNATQLNAASQPVWVPSTAPVQGPLITPVTLTLRDATGNQSTTTVRVTVLAPNVASTPSLTWTGAANIDWNDCGNWSYGLVPAAAQSVTIPAGLSRYPVLSTGTASLRNLTVAGGASFTLGSTATLQVTGSVNNQGPALAGTVHLTGSEAQTLAGNVGSVVVEKTGGTVTLSNHADVATSLTMTSGVLSTGSYTLTLGSAATLVESETSYVTGAVQTTRDVSSAGAVNSFGGLGLTLTPAAGSTALPGSTLVRRVTGTPLTGQLDRQGIARYFDIQPTVNQGLNVSLTFGYLENELNGIGEEQLTFFRSTSGLGGPWQPVAVGSRSTAANTVSVTGVEHFSVWTLGSRQAPLPVELLSFTATQEGPDALLRWATAQEKDNDRFELEVSTDGQRFAAIGTVAGQGTTASRTDYRFRDAQLLLRGANVVHYRLRQVDLDGTATLSVVRSVSIDRTGQSRLKLVPNPTRLATTLTGSQPGAAVQVFDAVGRQVLTATADAAGTAHLVLPAHLPAGVYLVRSSAQTTRLVLE